MRLCAQKAIQAIKKNSRGSYTVPAQRLYPFQWNWDSGFTALGLSHFDKQQAWLEIQTLLASQWKDGMVPHIVFHVDDPDYFPGPEVWQINARPATSGHSQPPILASIILKIIERGTSHDLKRAGTIFPKLMAYHRWFASARDPHKTGVIGIIHPWESGRDNCPDWDIAMDPIVIPDNMQTYERRDVSHIDINQRPTQTQYDKFITILEFARRTGWDHRTIYSDGLFLMADPGVQFIFLRASRDLLKLSELLGQGNACSEIQEWINRFSSGSEWLWNDAVGGYCARDIRTGQFSDAITNASMLCFYGDVGTATQKASMLEHCRRILKICRYGMPSWDPEHAKFDARRYWRGPVWAIMNYMIANGLKKYGENLVALRIISDTQHLIESYGMAEYFDPHNGIGLGGNDFSWTAAIYLENCCDSDATL